MMIDIDHISYFDESNDEVRHWAYKLRDLRDNSDASEKVFSDIVENHSIAIGEEIVNRMYVGSWWSKH